MPKIAVVIPSYRVKASILGVIKKVDPKCTEIFVVDDKCPEESGRFVEENNADDRVRVLYHDNNRGVGAAVITGYEAALKNGADIIVKIDGDGQMDPSLIPRFVGPLLRGEADYTKGNRFYSLYNVRQMPLGRVIGNALLSFLTKLSSGYWSVFDPTNGYTAIHASVVRELRLVDISERYFFESDMLINLANIRAVVLDIPMEAVYGNEQSNIKIGNIFPEFIAKHFRGLLKRILYNYFLRDFTFASVNLIVGVVLVVFGMTFGGIEWWRSIASGTPATAGTVIIAALPMILGFQLLLNFVSYDISSEPKIPLQRNTLLTQATRSDSELPSG